MTDRVYALTVTLEKDTRTDDVEFIVNAIRAIRGVLDVTQMVADPGTYMAEMRAKRELADKLWDVLYPKEK